jgi:hypothetical protein
MPLMTEFMSRIVPHSRYQSCEIVIDRAKIPVRTTPVRTVSGSSHSRSTSSSAHSRGAPKKGARWEVNQENNLACPLPVLASRSGTGSSRLAAVSDTPNKATSGLGQPPVRGALAWTDSSSSSYSSSSSSSRSVKSGDRSRSSMNKNQLQGSQRPRRCSSLGELKASSLPASYSLCGGSAANDDHGQKLVDLIQRLSLRAAITITGHNPTSLAISSTILQQAKSPPRGEEDKNTAVKRGRAAVPMMRHALSQDSLLVSYPSR